MAKYGRVAEQNNLRFVPAVFSHTGQIHGEFKALVKEQIRHKLIAFEGEAKCSKIRSVMKWWSRCISMAIAKTASRNVAFKVAKMRDSIMEDQDELIIRNSESEELGLDANAKDVLEDLGHNADTDTLICISPIMRTTRKIRNLASAELCATSKYEVVGYLIYK